MGSSSSVHSRYMEGNEMLNYFRKETCINQIQNKRGESVPALVHTKSASPLTDLRKEHFVKCALWWVVALALRSKRPRFLYLRAGAVPGRLECPSGKKWKRYQREVFMEQVHCLYFKWNKDAEASQHYTSNEWVLVFRLPSKMLIFEHGKIDIHGFDAALFTLWAVKQKISGKTKRVK